MSIFDITGIALVISMTIVFICISIGVITATVLTIKQSNVAAIKKYFKKKQNNGE